MSEHNPNCSKNRCRACCGYGVLVPRGGGPFYEACPGEDTFRDRMVRLFTETTLRYRATPRWRVRERRRLKDEREFWFRRYQEVAPQ